MTYPEEFRREARARIVNAKAKAQKAFRDAQNDVPPFPLGAITRYVMTVFHAFAKEACALARAGVWGVDRVETEVSQWMYSTIIFAESEQGVDGFRFRRLLTDNGMAIRSDILALFKLENEWKLYEDELIEISDMQGGGSESLDSIPIRGHRAQVRDWMKKNGITSVSVAARRLAVSESTLKSIMTDRGRVRHSRETLERVLAQIKTIGG
jgi:hypothetical protein